MSLLIKFHLRFQKFKNRLTLKYICLLFLLFTISGFSSCTDQNVPVASSDVIILKGSQSQEITLYGNKYNLFISNIKDNRCYMNSTVLGDYGLEVELSIKSLKDCVIDTCKSQSISLFLPNCDTSRISVDDLFSDTNQKRGINQPAFDFVVGISHAIPYQITNPPKKYSLSDYELTLFTKKQ